MKLDTRARVRIAVAVVVVVLLGWQWWSMRHVQSAPAPAAVHVHAVSAAPVKRVAPATLRLGRVTLSACELKRPNSSATLAAFCAKFPVPEDRAHPQSRTILLSLAIVKSASQVPDKDLVVYLAGGPGQSAIQTYPELVPAFAPLLKHHDVLLLDQRGTGGSHALTCPAAARVLGALPAAASAAQRATVVGQCAREVGQTADPRDYTTTAAVADLEAVRQALGAPRLDLVGVSYGTRVAQHYATAHPAAVRSIVLDGVVPNPLVLGETFATTLERSLQLQAAGCTATPACKRAFGDWNATLHQLFARLRHAPAQQLTFADPFTYRAVTRTLDADTLAGVVRMFSYNAATAALLPLAVSEAARGNYAPLLGQSQIMRDDLSASLEGGMQLSVICTEDAPLLRPRPEDAGLLLGDQLITAFSAECRAWPHGPMPKGFHAPFESAIPTLLISGERDPVTPPAFAAEVLQGLGDGRALVVRGLGHAEAINTGCMPRLVDQFIDKLQPKQLDAKCLERIGPTPAFINFNGAAP